MSDREAFIRYIADHPHADLPRLVFADWLDERDDPLGLFIRTQIELDPIREQIELLRVRELLVVEEQLLEDHRETWLRPAEGLLRDNYSSGPHFRRGLPHAVCLTAQELGEHGECLMEAFPTVRELAVCELSGDPTAVANHEFLRRVDVLELADIPDPDDFATLMESNLFGRQRTIRLWNAGHGTSPLFGITPDRWKPSGTVEYVQLLGGVMAGAEHALYDRDADDCADEFNAVWGEGHIRVIRPYQRTYSIHEEEDSFPCGRFPDGRYGMVFYGRRDEQVAIAVFDGMRHVGTRYHTPPTPKTGYWDDTLVWLRTELQLAPASIRVPQFRTERMHGVQHWPQWWVAALDQGHFTNWRQLWEWKHNGRYCIEGLGGHWADYRGFVTDS